MSARPSRPRPWPPWPGPAATGPPWAWAGGEGGAVSKPVQTGEPAGTPPAAPGDLAVEHALTGLDDLHELARYPDPLSPEAAARTAGQAPLDLRRAADYIAALAEDRDLVLVEGAGGLLVRYDPAGTTIADLAAMLDAPVLVVTAAGLGTLNHTALTLEALATRKLACAGVVVGSWPAGPGLAERCNLDDLELLTGGTLAGILPAGAGELERGAFTEVARQGLGPALGGVLDVAAFRAAAVQPASPRAAAAPSAARSGQQTIG